VQALTEGAKALLAALEETVLVSGCKKGANEFTLLAFVGGGSSGGAGQEKALRQGPVHRRRQGFAAKRASVRLNAPPLKQLKDATL
jgi:hypothetical protein